MRVAQRQNNNTYPEASSSGVARLCCLSCEVFGRWGADPLEIVPALAWERARGLPSRIREGMRLRLMARWWGLLGIAVQRAVSSTVLRERGGDLFHDLLETPPHIVDV